MKTMLTVWLALKGFRTLIWASMLGAISALIGAAEMMDWAPVLRANLPTVPAWGLGLVAAAVTGALRAITTTPLFKKDA